jgi:hypothetical protein
LSRVLEVVGEGEGGEGTGVDASKMVDIAALGRCDFLYAFCSWKSLRPILELNLMPQFHLHVSRHSWCKVKFSPTYVCEDWNLMLEFALRECAVEGDRWVFILCLVSRSMIGEKDN